MNELEKVQALREELLQDKEDAIAECNFDLAMILRDVGEGLNKAIKSLSNFFSPEKTICDRIGHDMCLAKSIVLTNPARLPWICRRCTQEGTTAFGMAVYIDDEYSMLRLKKAKDENFMKRVAGVIDVESFMKK